MKSIFILLACLLGNQAFSQSVKILTQGTKTSIRGLSVVTDRVLWVSGSSGTVGRSLDSGNTWKWMLVKGFEKTDFRDIEAFNETTAVIMGIASPAHILRTNDGGESWQLVFKDTASGMFLDAMEFWNEQSGIVIGDPIDGKIFIARSFDGGQSWQGVPDKNKPAADKGEACFASSGTNVRALNLKAAIMVTGGLSSHVIAKDKKIKLPLLQGTESTGANSIAVKNSKTWMVVGGDFNTKDSTVQNAAITFNGGKSWHSPLVPPGGYRSCVEFIKDKTWITCGLNGVDITTDNGHTFKSISKQGFHVVRRAKAGKSVFFAGGSGKIGKLSRD